MASWCSLNFRLKHKISRFGFSHVINESWFENTHIPWQMMLQQVTTLWDTCCRSPAPLRPDRSPEDTDDTPPPGRNCQQDKRLETEKLDWVTGQTDDCRDGGAHLLPSSRWRHTWFYSDISHKDQTWLKLWAPKFEWRRSHTLKHSAVQSLDVWAEQRLTTALAVAVQMVTTGTAEARCSHRNQFGLWWQHGAQDSLKSLQKSGLIQEDTCNNKNKLKM